MSRAREIHLWEHATRASAVPIILQVILHNKHEDIIIFHVIYISTSQSCKFIYLCQTQQRSIITRRTKTHKQDYQALRKAQTCVLIQAKCNFGWCRLLKNQNQEINFIIRIKKIDQEIRIKKTDIISSTLGISMLYISILQMWLILHFSPHYGVSKWNALRLRLTGSVVQPQVRYDLLSYKAIGSNYLSFVVTSMLVFHIATGWSRNCDNMVDNHRWAQVR